MLAMIPSEYTGKSGIRSAMRELALKMLAHNPSHAGNRKPASMKGIFPRARW